MVGALAVAVLLARHLDRGAVQVGIGAREIDGSEGAEHRFGQRQGPPGAVDPRGRQVDPVRECVHHDHRSVVPTVVSVGKRIAAVDLLELAGGPAERVPQPTRGPALLLLEEEFESIGVPHPLRHLVLPRRVEGVGEAGPLAVADQARHRLVVGLDAALHAPVGLGPAEGPLLAGLRRDAVGGRDPEIGRERQPLVGQQVDELVHPRVRGLDGAAVGQPVIQGCPGLERGEIRPVDAEQGRVQPHVGLEVGVQPHLVLNEQEMLVGPDLLRAEGGVDGAEVALEFSLERGGPGVERVQRNVGPEAQAVAVVERVEEVHPRTEVDDAALVQARQPGGVGIAHRPDRLAELDARVEFVLAPGQGDVGKQLRPPLVVPPECRDPVAPIKPEVDKGAALPEVLGGLEAEVIGAVKHAQVHPVPLADAPIDLAVEVVKEIPRLGLDAGVLFVGGVDDGAGQDIEVGAAPTDHEGGLVLDDGTFDHELGGEQGHIDRAVGLAQVAVLHLHFHHGRQASSKPGGKAPFGDGHPLDRVRVEHREETEQVAHAVERHSVEDNQVLVGTATPDVQAGGAFPTGLHARHELERLEQVHLPSDGRQLAHLVHRNLNPRHLDRVFDALPIAAHHGLLQGHAGLKRDVEAGVGGQVHLERLGGVPDVRHGQRMLALRKGEGIESEGIRSGPNRLRGAPERGPGQHFTAGRILHVAVELDRLGLKEHRVNEQADQHRTSPEHGAKASPPPFPRTVCPPL